MVICAMMWPCFSCPDMDECSAANVCPGQLCLNSPGSYTCRSCGAGLQLTQDGYGCEGKSRLSVYLSVWRILTLMLESKKECIKPRAWLQKIFTVLSNLSWHDLWDQCRETAAFKNPGRLDLSWLHGKQKRNDYLNGFKHGLKLSHIYHGVCVFEWKCGSSPGGRSPTDMCLCAGKNVSQNKAESKSASDRILMDASDAMENIKGLIWNEVNHSPAVRILQRARPVELAPLTPKAKKSGAFSIT